MTYLWLHDQRMPKKPKVCRKDARDCVTKTRRHKALEASLDRRFPKFAMVKK